MTDSRQDRRALLPPRIIPLVYYGVARVALVAALLAAAWDPVPIVAFFYHTRMLALVHLITLGWITCSILGSLYIVGPFSLRIALPAGALDYVASALASTGVIGVTAAFWWNQSASVGWSGMLFLPAVAIVAVRTLVALRHAPVPRAVTLHLALAFVNFFLAAVAGIAIAFDKTHHFLPGALLTNVYAHAHLAAVGWVGMLTVGVAYRLFPMVLPAAMPVGSRLYASALLLEAGILALATGLVLRMSWATIAGAFVVASGFGAFLLEVRLMLRSRKAPPAALPRPDYGALQSIVAVMFLALTVATGLYLAMAPLSEQSLRIAAAYGAMGLVGFFSQLIAGMEYRLLPYFAWYWAFANTGFKGPVPTPHEMPVRGIQRVSFFLWLAGVPLVVSGMLLTRPRALAAGAWLLLGAVLVGAVDAAAIALHAFSRPQSR
jgi:hypothetical protein